MVVLATTKKLVGSMEYRQSQVKEPTATVDQPSSQSSPPVHTCVPKTEASCGPSKEPEIRERDSSTWKTGEGFCKPGREVDECLSESDTTLKPRKTVQVRVGVCSASRLNSTVCSWEDQRRGGKEEMFRAGTTAVCHGGILPLGGLQHYLMAVRLRYL